MTMTNVKKTKAYEENLKIPHEYKKDAYKYCVMVLSGGFVTFKNTRLAWIRHLKNKKSSIEEKEVPFVYKTKRAKKNI